MQQLNYTSTPFRVSLPVRASGLGVRLVLSLASSALLALAAGTRDLHADPSIPDDAFECNLPFRLDIRYLRDPVGADVSNQRSWGQASDNVPNYCTDP